ncbi:MAG TPA: hypothetical protein VFI25_19580 [Planctomycetota bacterium]|jgi:MraZ protein|nr:hypothetical protein [Planctomycetota bacterium]
MFAGESAHSLDEKNRLVVPKRILDALEREEERERFYLTRGVGGCLYLFTEARFGQISRELGGRAILEKPQKRAFKRILFASSQLVFLDGQNRILLPETLKGVGRIDREVVVVGVGDHVEIWAAERWKGFQEEMESRFDELADLLDEGGDGKPEAPPRA